MFSHIGILTLKPTTSDEQVLDLAAALEALVGVVPGLVSATVERDAKLREGNAELFFRMQFDEQASWEGYSTHPAHVAVITNHIAPVLLSKAFVQVAG
jgi:hypothetical protein